MRCAARASPVSVSCEQRRTAAVDGDAEDRFAGELAHRPAQFAAAAGARDRDTSRPASPAGAGGEHRGVLARAVHLDPGRAGGAAAGGRSGRSGGHCSASSDSPAEASTSPHQVDVQRLAGVRRRRQRQPRRGPSKPSRCSPPACSGLSHERGYIARVDASRASARCCRRRPARPPNRGETLSTSCPRTTSTRTGSAFTRALPTMPAACRAAMHRPRCGARR